MGKTKLKDLGNLMIKYKIIIAVLGVVLFDLVVKTVFNVTLMF